MGGIIFVILLVLGVPICILIWLGILASRAAREVDELKSEFTTLQIEVRVLRREMQERHRPAAAAAPASQPTTAPSPRQTVAPLVAPEPPVLAKLVDEKPVVVPPAAPITPLPVVPKPQSAPLALAPARQPVQPPIPPTTKAPIPPPVAPSVYRSPIRPVEAPAAKQVSIDWEQLLGVKLFAWIGGFIMFLALVFFINYAFEHHWISPPMQVAGEYLVAAVLLGGGLWLNRKEVPVLAQTLDATGIVGLYAVTFAAHSYYKLVGSLPTFGVMTLITATAFVLAVRLDAQVIAILGLVGGFLTPVMVPTGQDNPVGLFGYIAFLDVGLILVALRKRWNYLIALGVIGTAILQMAWVFKFFEPAKIMTALVVFTGFEALFVGTFALARKRGQSDHWISVAAVAGAMTPLLFVLTLFGKPELAETTGLFFVFILAMNGGLIYLAQQTQWRPLVPLAAIITMIVQMAWVVNFFAGPKLWETMGVVLGFEMLFLMVFVLKPKSDAVDNWSAAGAAAMALLPFWFADYLLDHNFLYLPGHILSDSRTWLYFAFVLAADAGLLAVAWRSRWGQLAAVAAFGTIILEIGWVGQVFKPDHVRMAMGILLGFDALFLLIFACAEKWKRSSGWLTASVVAMAFVPVGFALYLQDYPTIAANQPALYFGFLLLADIVFAVVAMRRLSAAYIQVAGGGAVFFVLARWTTLFLTPALLNWALGVILLFGALHAIFPVVLKRLRPDAVGTRWWQLFPLLSLGMVLVPILRLPDVPWAVWVCVLVLDALLFVLAVMSAAVLAMIGAIVLTMVVAASWIFKIPVIEPPITGLILVIGGFAVFFFGISIWATRRLKSTGSTPATPPWFPVPLNLEMQLPAMGAVLPFMLLILATGRLTLASSSPIFGLALLLVVLLLAVVRLTETDLLAVIALGCTVLLEAAWRERFFTASLVDVSVPVLWHLAIDAVFTIFPFLFMKRLLNRSLPWVVAALAGPLQFWFIYPLVKQGWPALEPYLGIVPAAFVVPSLAGFLMLRKVPMDCPQRLSHLAWFGGVTLFFITLIFPIQFEHQWLTIAWGLEGAALLWLFHKLPHPGLRVVGVALLVTAFVRLALNPAVLSYHARGPIPIWNWYLYSYGLVTVSLFLGARLLAPPRNQVLDINAPPLLYTLGTLLAFLLLNIEIADFFLAPGTRVCTFEFSSNFARDMTYSIAWSLFALILLLMGISKKLPIVRYASLGLLCVTLLKLFLHDFAHLHQLYRIGAFVGVSMVLLLASYLYQKFVKPELKSP